MTENTTRREDGTEAAPSEVIGPDTLDQALLTVVIRADGTAVTFVSSLANREAVADWLHEVAETVRRAPDTCEACRDGADHSHQQA